MADDKFNLEDEYGDLLDLLDEYISEVDPTLEHFGVKGMKWGVRKADRPAAPSLKSLGPESVSRKTKNGETITLQKVTPTKLHEFLGRHSKTYRDDYSRQATLKILDGSGKKVGDAMVQKKNKDELYLEWLGINKSARGKGYATAVMKAGRDFGKQEGFKRMVLEVPGNSLDARHIYENLGFKYVGEVDGGTKDPIWGGLSNMVYDFDAKHSDSDHIVHYGIKGMKWGVHKSEDSAARTPAKPMVVDPRVHSSTRDGALEVSRLMGDRYGYNLGAVRVLDKSHPHYEEGKDALAFVENNQRTGGGNNGTVFVQARNMSRELKEAADEGWTADGTGTVQGLITHESAHAMMHSNLTITTNSRGKQKVTGEHTKARDKAWAAAEKAGRREGYSIWDVSDYARTAMERAEIEAELFSAYHWGTNPPRFVQEWGQTLHKEMGVDPTPFKEVRQ